ncbi:MAG: hypothetical protein C5B60_00455 [Chloroflexi bacterium]|nr:MAG: hypothetical protein C5B60_00455 [Chloroflexota bacterium]
MSSVTLYRASGLALLLGAALVIIGLPMSFFFTPDSPLALAMIGVWTGGVVLVQLGLPGIVVRQAARAGWLGAVGFLLLFSGGFLLASFFAVLDLTVFPWLDVRAPLLSFQFFTANSAVHVYLAVVSALFGVGGVLLGIATMRAGVFPRWAGLLLIVGLVSLGAAFVNVLLIVTLVFGMIGLGWIGYALVTSNDEAIPQRVAA